MSLKKIENPDLFRGNIRKKLEAIIKDEKNTLNLEKGIFNYALKEAEQRKIVKKWDNAFFVQIYLNHLRSIITNLSADILKQIESGDIKPHQVAFMTHHEMRPDKWSALIDAKSKRDKNKFEVNLSAATDSFTCRKCKGNKCTYMQLQTRSADESMTTYVSCITCSARWKF